MTIPIYQVDSFTGVPFRGNPAAVCILSAPQPDEWMRSVAMEMNLSETAFLLKEGDACRLRWFTPRVEADLCGHATLASAHVLWESGREPKDRELRFNTRSGELTARRNKDWIEMNFPGTDCTPAEPPPGLFEALGVEAVFVWKYRGSYLAEYADEAQVRTLRPDFSALEKVDSRIVIVTARADNTEFDFISRLFSPQLGVPEDPVTGSSHAVLAPYWAGKLGKTNLRAYQASARGGELRLRLDDERVIIAGQAVTVFEGSISA